MEEEQTLKDKVESSILTSIGISNFPLSVLKRFKEFAYREAEGSYAKSIELLLDFFESGVVRILQNHEERIAKLENSNSEKKVEKPFIKRFGGENE